MAFRLWNELVRQMRLRRRPRPPPPELTASATAAEVADLEGQMHEAYVASNRMCELGMTRTTGREYRHIQVLKERDALKEQVVGSHPAWVTCARGGGDSVPGAGAAAGTSR